MLQACTTESVSDVVVGSVRVEPAYAAMTIGGGVQFAAFVVDDAGVALAGAEVTWSSDTPGIVSVDGRGLGRALSDGVATIQATFLNVSGSTTVVVLPPPRIQLSPGSLSLMRAAGGRVPPSAVAVTVGGAGTLGRLAAEVRYGSGEPTGWLTADLARTTAPTTLTVYVDPDELESGVHSVAVRVTSDEAGVTAVELPIRVTLAGFTIRVPDGGVMVKESRTAEAFDVVLDLEPVGDVVVSAVGVESEAVTLRPSSLTFTPKNWSAPRTAQVTAADDVDLNGDRTVFVRVSVTAEPGTAYAAVDDQIVEVTILDDDVAGLVLIETGKGTSAKEGTGADTFEVVLTARPRSQVILTVSVDDPTDARVTPDQLTFTPATWNVPQSVAFSAVEDGVRDGTKLRTVTVSVRAQGSDPAFHGVEKSIKATTIDRTKDSWR